MKGQNSKSNQQKTITTNLLSCRTFDSILAFNKSINEELELINSEVQMKTLNNECDCQKFNEQPKEAPSTKNANEVTTGITNVISQMKREPDVANRINEIYGTEKKRKKTSSERKWLIRSLSVIPVQAMKNQ